MQDGSQTGPRGAKDGCDASRRKRDKRPIRSLRRSARVPRVVAVRRCALKLSTRRVCLELYPPQDGLPTRSSCKSHDATVLIARVGESMSSLDKHTYDATHCN